MRWSLPKEEVCFCQGVVAPVTNICQGMEKTYADDEMLFFGDPRELTLRRNWRKDELDNLLNRIEYCGNSLRIFDMIYIYLNNIFFKSTTDVVLPIAK